VFEILLEIDFSYQPNTGLGATKQRHIEKAGTIIRAPAGFMVIGGFVCELWWF